MTTPIRGFFNTPTHRDTRQCVRGFSQSVVVKVSRKSVKQYGRAALPSQWPLLVAMLSHAATTSTRPSMYRVTY